MTSSKKKWHHGFNLQLWELGPMTDVWVGDVVIAEKGHLTLWLAMSGCQVGGGAKEGKKQWDFFSLSQYSKHQFHMCSTLSLIPSDKPNEVIMVISIKSEEKKVKQYFFFFLTQHTQGISTYLNVRVKYSQDNICRLKSWNWCFFYSPR